MDEPALNPFLPLLEVLSWQRSNLTRLIDRVAQAHVKTILNEGVYGCEWKKRGLNENLSSLSKQPHRFNATIKDPECFSHTLAAVRDQDTRLIDFIRARAADHVAEAGETKIDLHRFISPLVVMVADEYRNGSHLFLKDLNQAISSIQATAPHAFTFLLRFVTRVELITEATPYFNSASNNMYPRRVQLINMHMARGDIETVANALVHEAIHSFLYLLELEIPLLMNEPRHLKLESPWTGNRISIHSYIHACFVWFGLSRFWKSDQVRKVFRPQDRERHFRAAMKGFLASDICEPLLELKESMHPWLVPAIRELQKRV
jgi:hypothetical protein